MDSTKENLILNAISLVLSIGSLAVAVWVVATGRMLETGIDGLFLVLVCLLLCLVFAINPLLAIRSGLLKQLLSRKAKVTAQEEQKVKVAVN